MRIAVRTGMAVFYKRIGVSLITSFACLLFVIGFTTDTAHAALIKLPSSVDADNKIFVNMAGLASSTVNGSCNYQFFDNIYPASTTIEKSGLCTMSDFTIALDTIDLDTLTNNSSEYWISLTNTDDGNDYYAVWSCTGAQTCTGDASGNPNNPLGSFSYGFNSTLNTRFLDVDILNSGNDIQVDVTYFLDPNEINPTIPEFNPTLVGASYSLRPITTFSSEANNIDNTQTATQTTSIIINDADIDNNGTFDLLIQYDNLGRQFSGIRPFADSYVYTSFTLVNKNLTATGTLEFYDSTQVSTSTSVYRACGLTELDGCLVNAFTFLFIPSDTTTNNFASLQTTSSGKFPFAYFFSVKDIIESAQDGSGTITSLTLAAPPGSPIQYNVEYFSEDKMMEFFNGGTITLFRSLIEISLWLALMTMMFYSIRGIFNQPTA